MVAKEDILSKKVDGKAPKVKNDVAKGGSGVHEIAIRRDQ